MVWHWMSYLPLLSPSFHHPIHDFQMHPDLQSQRISKTRCPKILFQIKIIQTYCLEAVFYRLFHLLTLNLFMQTRTLYLDLFLATLCFYGLSTTLPLFGDICNWIVRKHPENRWSILTLFLNFPLFIFLNWMSIFLCTHIPMKRRRKWELRFWDLYYIPYCNKFN